MWVHVFCVYSCSFRFSFRFIGGRCVCGQSMDGSLFCLFFSIAILFCETADGLI